MTSHCSNTRFNPLLMMLLALFMLTVQGCGGGGSDPVTNADPTGYYTDSGFVNVKAADDTTQRLVNNIQGMVANGQLMMLSDSENIAYIGTFTVSGNDFNGSVTVYEAGVMIQQDVSVTGLITEDSSLTGTLGGSGVANGTFRLNYAADNGPVNLAQLERTFDWRSVVNLNIPNLNLADTALVAVFLRIAPIVAVSISSQTHTSIPSQLPWTVVMVEEQVLTLSQSIPA